MTLARVAFIYKNETPLNYQRMAVLKDVMSGAGIDCRVFNGIVPMTEAGFDPDCILILNANEAKLGHWPTYAVLDASPMLLLSKKRLIRNILSCDGYLVTSPVWAEAVNNLAFSARKFGAASGRFGLTPSYAYFGVPDFSQAKVAYITSDVGGGANHRKYFLRALRKSGILNVYTSSNRFKRLSRIDCQPVLYDPAAVAAAYKVNGIGLDLLSCDEERQQISWRLQEIIAAGAVAITNWSPYLYKIFGDNLLYIPKEATAKQGLKIIRGHIEFVRNNPALAQEKTAVAFAIFKERFAMESLVGNIEKLHEQILDSQGYRAPAVPLVPDPSVSIIMRTGAQSRYIRRALDSLVAQSYSNIQVILVPYQPVIELDKLIKDYSPHLKFKIVENIGGLRSKSILLGMQNVDTDYFGMLDDDDTVNANHIRSLINTLQYHNNLDWRGAIRMAYSGAYFVSDNMAFDEPPEWHDDLLDIRPEKRQIEHYRFYDSDKMAKRHWYMMSNSWLAHRSLVDHELLQDSHTHTGEDLYFQMQFALRTQFAFSAEVTAAHWFYGGNSTIVDRERHLRDNFRHITRLSLRSYPSMVRHWLSPKEIGSSTGIEGLPVLKGAPTTYLHRLGDKQMTYVNAIAELAVKFMMHVRRSGIKQTARQIVLLLYQRLQSNTKSKR